jgi:hypothetical protein
MAPAIGSLAEAKPRHQVHLALVTTRTTGLARIFGPRRINQLAIYTRSMRTPVVQAGDLVAPLGEKSGSLDRTLRGTWGSPGGLPSASGFLGCGQQVLVYSVGVSEVPPNPQSPLSTSSHRHGSLSIETIVSAFFRVMSWFCLNVQTPSSIFRFMKGSCFLKSVI